LVLNTRQIFAIIKGSYNSFVSKVTSQEEFKVSKSYNIEKLVLSIAKSIFEFSKFVFFIKINFFVIFYEKIADILKNYNEINNQVVFMLAFVLFSFVIDLPFSIISTFFVEQRYGFNNTKVTLFIKDILKSLVLMIVFLYPIIFSSIYIISNVTAFFLYLFVFIVTVQILLAVIYPALIQPLFNKFSPLEDGELKTRILNLATEKKFPCKKILVIDSSMRTSHSNAYFTGLFKEKKIVLFDTLLKNNTNEEILAILAHEIGHWYHCHIWMMLLIQLVYKFMTCYILKICIQDVTFSYALFGNYKPPIILKILYSSFLISIISPIINFLMNSCFRKFERQADEFAVRNKMSHHLKEGLIKLHRDNKSNLCVDWLYSAYNYSHPTLKERLENITKLEKEIRVKEE